MEHWLQWVNVQAVLSSFDVAWQQTSSSSKLELGTQD